MKKKYILLVILSPVLVIALIISGPFFALHQIVDGRSYDKK